MSASIKSKAQKATLAASANVKTLGRSNDDRRLLQEIVAIYEKALPLGSKVLVMTDAEVGWNVVVWSPKGKIINSGHGSGYFCIRYLGES